jgi:hypothetical protein
MDTLSWLPRLGKAMAIRLPEAENERLLKVIGKDETLSKIDRMAVGNL